MIGVPSEVWEMWTDAKLITFFTEEVTYTVKIKIGEYEQFLHSNVYLSLYSYFYTKQWYLNSKIYTHYIQTVVLWDTIESYSATNISIPLRNYTKEIPSNGISMNFSLY